MSLVKGLESLREQLDRLEPSQQQAIAEALASVKVIGETLPDLPLALKETAKEIGIDAVSLVMAGRKQKVKDAIAATFPEFASLLTEL